MVSECHSMSLTLLLVNRAHYSMIQKKMHKILQNNVKTIAIELYCLHQKDDYFSTNKAKFT